MTEERKQELRQLLEEAMGSLVIRRSKAGVSLPSIDINQYRKLLLHRWTSQSENSPLVWENFELDIINKTTKSKLLDFIREEYAPFINEDRIQSACSFISASLGGGYPLNDFLEQLMNIAIGRGIERAVSDFDKYTKETHASVRYMALLEGIKLERKIQVFEGIQLIPLPSSSSDLPGYLPSSMIGVFDRSASFLHSKTLFVIDYFISPVFYSPLQHTAIREKFYTFSTNVTDAFENSCQALSLACNSAVQISLKWPFWPEDELFYLTPPGPGPPQISGDFGPFGRPTEAKETDVEEAECLYEKLVNLDQGVKEKLRIPIDRWIKSKAGRDPVDQMIDLGIVLEALYLLDTDEKTELSFRFRLRAAWHLGKNKGCRNELLKKFRQIYDCRSKAVHRGKLGETAQFGDEDVSISEFIARAQALCKESILKIIEDKRFPDTNYWNSLILGGEGEQASS